MRALALAFALVVSGTAFARQPKAFADTDETAQSTREKAPKHRVDHYDDLLPKTDKPFPWRAFGLLAIAMVVAAPFGIRTWRNLSNEMLVKRDEPEPLPKD